MPRAAFVVLIASMVAGSVTTSHAQLPTKFVNLQVFPPDTPPGVLVGAMKNFTRYLGVRCPFCHVGEEGMPLDKFDFAADTKPQKNIARAMMRMTAEINATLGKAIPDLAARKEQAVAPDARTVGGGVEATCFTCHRGAQKPVHAP